MKKILTFEVPKEIEVEEETISTDENGNEQKTIKKIKKPVPQKFFIQKPNRELRDGAELYYNTVFAEGVKAGLLTHTLLAKRYNVDGGILTDSQKSEYIQSYTTLINLEERQQLIKLKAEVDRTDEEKAELVKIPAQIADLQSKITEYNFERQTVFNSTAETRAKNKTILWYSLFLSHKENTDGTSAPFFGNGKFEERLKKYDEYLEQENTFEYDVALRFMYITMVWFENSNATEKELLELLDLFVREQNLGRPVGK